MEENIRKKGLRVRDICTMTHLNGDIPAKAWDDVKNVWLDPSKVREARAEEMDFVKKMKVYDKVPRTEAPGKPIPVRWVDTNKVQKETPTTDPG